MNGQIKGQNLQQTKMFNLDSNKIQANLSSLLDKMSDFLYTQTGLKIADILKSDKYQKILHEYETVFTEYYNQLPEDKKQNIDKNVIKTLSIIFTLKLFINKVALTKTEFDSHFIFPITKAIGDILGDNTRLTIDNNYVFVQVLPTIEIDKKLKPIIVKKLMSYYPQALRSVSYSMIDNKKITKIMNNSELLEKIPELKEIKITDKANISIKKIPTPKNKKGNATDIDIIL